MTNSEIGTIYIEDLEIGLSRSLSKVIGDAEIEMFATLSEDRNPVHLDDDYAKASMFKTRIAHGMLSAALFSALIGERLPGHGTIYLGQNLRFTAPVKPGDLVTATVTVTDINLAKRRVKLDCISVGDTVVIKGDALVLAPSKAQSCE
ncbi:MAG: MaoC family dehydratase [Alphaproteobacteria bacterium]|nr:MaoC family dehydratase [Alphaproteobacteria bacterium]